MPDPSPQPGVRTHLTLALCTVLHAFTHAYGTMLVPLYLLMKSDLRLAGVNRASAVVTVYGLVNCLLSYGAGVFADRKRVAVQRRGDFAVVTAGGANANPHVLPLPGRPLEAPHFAGPARVARPDL